MQQNLNIYLNITDNEENIDQSQITILIYQISQKSSFEIIQDKLQKWQQDKQLSQIIIIIGLEHYTNQREVQIQNGIELSQSVDGFWLEVDRLSKTDKDYRKLFEIFEQSIQMILEGNQKYEQQNEIQQLINEEEQEYSEDLRMSQFGFGDEYYTKEELEYIPEEDDQVEYEEQDNQYVQYNQQQNNENSLLLTRQLPDMKFKMDTDSVYYDPIKPRLNKTLPSQQRVIDDLKQQRVNRLNSQIINMDQDRLENKLKNLQKKIKITQTQRHQKTLLLPKQKIKMNTMQFETHIKNKQIESEKFWSNELRKIRKSEQQPHSLIQYEQIWQTAPSYIQQSNKIEQNKKPIKILEIQLQRKIIQIPVYTNSIPYLLAKETVRTYDLDSYYIDKLKKLITEEKENYQQDQYYMTHKCVNKKITLDLLNGDQIRAILFKKDTLPEALQRICKQYQIQNEEEIQNLAQQIRLDISH